MRCILRKKGSGIKPGTVQAVIWALALVGAAVSFGGTESPSLARSLTVIASILAFVMAVMVTLLQADAASAEPRS